MSLNPDWHSAGIKGARLTKYAVIRPASDLPAGFLPHGVDGRWYDLSRMRTDDADDPSLTFAEYTAEPTGRYEVREDGAVAEVYEVHAGLGN